jgi:hypothetical protein
MKAPLTGGNAVTLASGISFVGSMAIDATSVYWTTIYPQGWAIMKVGLDGGRPMTVMSDPRFSPGSIAVDATSVYWTTSDIDQGWVMKIPLDGGTPTTLASGQAGPSYIAVDATSVYWVNKGYNIFYEGSVMSVPSGGGAPTTLVSGLNTYDILQIVVDANYVYWTSGGVPGAAKKAVTRIPLGGGTPTTLLTGEYSGAAIAVDATSIYWADWHFSAIMKMPLAGGLPTKLASGLAEDIAIDATNVYWTERAGGGGRVRKLGGTTCHSGVCGCPGVQETCFGTCVDTGSDPNNCGACGKVCADATVCLAGSCLRTSVDGGQ